MKKLPRYRRRSGRAYHVVPALNGEVQNRGRNRIPHTSLPAYRTSRPGLALTFVGWEYCTDKVR